MRICARSTGDASTARAARSLIDLLEGPGGRPAPGLAPPQVNFGFIAMAFLYAELSVDHELASD